MKKIDCILSLCTLLTLQTIYAQVNLEWAKRYNGPANATDIAYAIAVDETGYVYVTGGSQGDLTTIKYNSNGDSVWVRRWNRNPPGNELSYDIVIDDSGFVYVSGSSTIKYSPNGNLVWEALNNGAALGGFVLDDSSNIFTGCTNLSNYRTNKFNRNGVLIWTKTYNGPANDQDRIYDIGLDPWGNVIVTGGSWGIGTQWDYATIKYSPSGDEMWVRRYNGPAQDVPTDIAYALAVDDSGNVYVTGWSDGTDENADCLTIKYSPQGDSVWVRRFSGPGIVGYDIEVDKNYNVYITGLTNGSYMLIKYDSSGTFQWIRTSPGPGTFFIPEPRLVIDSSDNIYVTMNRRVTSTRFDNLIKKFDGLGNQLWEAVYSSSQPNESNYSNAVTLDNAGNVYIAGLGAITGPDYLTLKYSQITSVTQTSTEMPEEFMLYQNYPNPFNPVTRIRFDIASLGAVHRTVSLIVYDALGKEIETLVSEELKPGTYEVNWNAANLPSGVYFYRLQTEKYNETLKMILIK